MRTEAYLLSIVSIKLYSQLTSSGPYREPIHSFQDRALLLRHLMNSNEGKNNTHNLTSTMRGTVWLALQIGTVFA